jgi:hypothetical protein
MFSNVLVDELLVMMSSFKKTADDPFMCLRAS